MTEPHAAGARAAALAHLAQAIEQWQKNTYGATDFAHAWREGLAQGAFSPRAHEVSEGLLTRVESAQNFGGESCSFSTAEMVSAFEALLERLKTAK